MKLPTKKCVKCGKSKPATSKYFNKSKTNKGGLYYWCRSCQSIHHQEVVYGLSVVERQEIYAKQNGKCAVCNEPMPYSKANTDHNHVTGKVRGLLCVFCNTLTGYVEKQPERINKVKKYLKKHNL